MHSHTRALIAAATFAFITGRKVAGLYDHTAKQDLLIAAEFRDKQLQGFDGDRGVKFGGTLPELHDDGDRTFVSFESDGSTVKGYDRRSSGFYEAQVTDGLVQVYDHGAAAWFAYDVQDAESASSYHRGTAESR